MATTPNLSMLGATGADIERQDLLPQLARRSLEPRRARDDDQDPIIAAICSPSR